MMRPRWPVVLLIAALLSRAASAAETHMLFTATYNRRMGLYSIARDGSGLALRMSSGTGQARVSGDGRLVAAVASSSNDGADEFLTSLAYADGPPEADVFGWDEA